MRRVDPLKKIEDAELREFARSPDSSEKMSVIVEISCVEKASPRPRSVPRREEIAKSAPPKTDACRAGMDELEKTLRKMRLNETVRLEAAKAFVVDVSPAELRAVSRLPLAGVIRPNRRHRAPADF